MSRKSGQQKNTPKNEIVKKIKKFFYNFIFGDFFPEIGEKYILFG